MSWGRGRKEVSSDDIGHIVDVVLADSNYSGGRYNSSGIMNHTFEALKEVFPYVRSTNPGSREKLRAFLEAPGGKQFVIDIESTSSLSLYHLESRPLAYGILKDFAAKIADECKAELYVTLKACDETRKHAFYTFICQEVLRPNPSGQPDPALSRVCIDLIKTFNSFPYTHLLAHAFYGNQAATALQLGPTPLPGLLNGSKTAAYLRSLVTSLTRGDNTFENLKTLMSATPTQIQFCEQHKMDVEFLMFLIDDKIDQTPPNTSADGTIVVVTLADAEKRKLEKCGKSLAQLETIFALFPRDPSGAQHFLITYQDALFDMNVEMAALFAQDGKAMKEASNSVQGGLPIVVGVLGRAKTRADNDFLLAIFESLDPKHAIKALNVLADKGHHTGISDDQKRAIAIAFQSKGDSSEVKFNFFNAMLKCTFGAPALNAIGTLCNIISNRSKFVEALSSFEETNPLFDPQVIEIFQLLHKKGVSITYDYAVYLARLSYLPEFKGVIALFPENAIRTIFKPDSRKATAREWINAFMLQAVALGEPIYASEVFNLLYQLLSFAEAHALEIGLKRDALLGKEFNLALLGFIQKMKVSFALEPRKFFALQAEILKGIAMILPPISSTTSGGFLSSLFGGSKPISTAPPRIEDGAVTQILDLLDLQWSEGQRRFLPSFASEAQRGAYIEFIQEAKARMALTGQQSFLALEAAPPAPSVTASEEPDPAAKMLEW